MKVNFSINKSHGLSKDDVTIILNTLNELRCIYNEVVIEEVGDFYTKDKNEYSNMYNNLLSYYDDKESKKQLKELNIKKPTFSMDINGKKYSDDTVAAYYKNNSIFINHARERMSLEDYKKERTRVMQLVEKRRKIDPKLLKYIKIANPADVLPCTVWHEFGHALVEKYDLINNDEILNIYNSLSESDIDIELNVYASKDIEEFIACAFQESMFEDARPIAAKIRIVIDKVIGGN